MTWFNNYWPQLTGIAVVMILIWGRNKLLPGVSRSKVLLWIAFVVTAVCGLVLAWALFDLMGWLTSLPGLFGGIVGSVGAIVAVAAGWGAIAMLVDMIRDLADGVPDGQARRAALLVPVFLPAGVQAVYGIISNPRGIGTGLAAAIIAVISIIAVWRIVKAALAAKKGGTWWLWFAAGACLFAGVLMIPLLAYIDTLVAQYMPAPWPTIFRILGGAAGLTLLIAALVDIFKDRKPDGHVRRFLSYGLPALIVFGAVAVSFVAGNAESGSQILIGGM